MSDSYSRRCKYCGKWIQMRQMPQGQWVAFDGYDSVHKCSRQYEQLLDHYNSNNSTNRSQPTYRIPSYRPHVESSGCLTMMLPLLMLLIGVSFSHKK